MKQIKINLWYALFSVQWGRYDQHSHQTYKYLVGVHHLYILGRGISYLVGVHHLYILGRGISYLVGVHHLYILGRGIRLHD